MLTTKQFSFFSFAFINSSTVKYLSLSPLWQQSSEPTSLQQKAQYFTEGMKSYSDLFQRAKINLHDKDLYPSLQAPESL